MLTVGLIRREVAEHLRVMRHHKGKRWVLYATSTGVMRVGLEAVRSAQLMHQRSDCIAGVYTSSADVDEVVQDLLAVALQHGFMAAGGDE